MNQEQPFDDEKTDPYGERTNPHIIPEELRAEWEVPQEASLTEFIDKITEEHPELQSTLDQTNQELGKVLEEVADMMNGVFVGREVGDLKVSSIEGPVMFIDVTFLLPDGSTKVERVKIKRSE